MKVNVDLFNFLANLKTQTVKARDEKYYIRKEIVKKIKG